MTMMFEASYIYAEGERYNTGRGMAVLDSNVDRLHGLFDLYVSGVDGERYALRIKASDGTVIRERGDFAEAQRSMRAAYARRAG
jgi:hypothetical protein